MVLGIGSRWIEREHLREYSCLVAVVQLGSWSVGGPGCHACFRVARHYVALC